jgi:nucleoside-diphosphate-sugar epimerase
MRFFVTGASGFVGTHVVPRLRRHGDVVALHRPGAEVPAHMEGVPTIEGDLLEPEAWQGKVEADAILHLAAEASPERAQKDPVATLRANVEGTLNVLRCAQGQGARFVFLSTGQVYGAPGPGRITESSPLRPSTFYAATKAAAETLVHQAALGGTKAVVLRAFNMYGPGQVGPYVVPTVLEQAVRRGVIEPRVSTPVRDFLYIEDAADAIVKAVQGGVGTYNLASGRSRTIREVADILARLADVPVQHHDGPADELHVDSSAIQAALQWRPTTSLEDGLAKTLAWKRKGS